MKLPKHVFKMIKCFTLHQITYFFIFTGVYVPLILHTECLYSEIYKAPLGGDDLFSVANTLPLEHASCPSAVASNPAEGKVYWTDLTFKHIARANLDGTQEEIIVQNVNNSLGLVVDSYGGNIYFTDKDMGTVEVAKLDGSNRKVLIRSSTHQPVGLAIDPSRGYVTLFLISIFFLTGTIGKTVFKNNNPFSSCHKCCTYR